MKALKSIIAAYAKIDLHKQRAALATVVKVRGSSYRSPGARMLITDDGKWVGSISGGCLEGDALRTLAPGGRPRGAGSRAVGRPRTVPGYGAMRLLGRSNGLSLRRDGSSLVRSGIGVNVGSGGRCARSRHGSSCRVRVGLTIADPFGDLPRRNPAA